MPIDLSQVLKDAAGAPPRPLDMVAVRDRATRPRAGHRLRLWFWAALAVLGLGVPTGLTLAPGHAPPAVRTIEGDPPAEVVDDEVARDPGVDTTTPEAGGATGPGTTLPQAPLDVHESASESAGSVLGSHGRIAFTRRSAGGQTSELNVYDTATGEVTDLSVATEFQSDPAWSPDGGHLAYEARADGIYVIGADGSDHHLVAAGDALDAVTSPTWSPRGDEIAFVRGGADPIESGWAEIWVVGVDGSGQRLLTNTREQAVGSLAWSPDGRWIAFVVFETESVHVRVLDVVSGDTRDLGEGEEPAWSTSGDRVAFMRDGSIVVADIAAENGVHSRVVYWAPRDQVMDYLTWSPDGEWFAYAFRRSDNPSYNPPYSIWVVRADGSDARPLLTETTGGQLHSPAWGPA